MPQIPELLSARRAAVLLGISKRTLHRHVAKGLIPAVKLDDGPTGAYVIHRATVERILAAVPRAS